MNEFKSTHDLPFLTAAWPRDPEWSQFKIGTCHGLWRCTPLTYDILAIENDEKGNGHLQDVFDWFENSCRRDSRILRFMELMNERFEDYLKRKGFHSVGESMVKPIL